MAMHKSRWNDEEHEKMSKQVAARGNYRLKSSTQVVLELSRKSTNHRVTLLRRDGTCQGY
eukprot:397580-Pelagomonas_calceolata.AAC.8